MRTTLDLPEKLIDEAMKIGNVLNNQGFLRIFLSKLSKGPARQQCLAPYTCILIFVDGDVYPCGNFDRPVGNLFEGKSLEDIYQSYQPLRKMIWSGSHDRCSSCIYPDIVSRSTLRASVMSFVRKSIKKK